mmetsp:Transcript_23263/g.19272  ORF Transcript_23263/g.19272 Transcript_23263/m.19272 type:complete len:94 (+) Transcript_23263:171-452(+)
MMTVIIILIPLNSCNIPSATGPGTLRSISPESRSAIEVMGWSSNPKWIAPKKTELTADIANLGTDGDTSAVLDSKGKPIMLMLKFGENATNNS